MCVRRPPYIKLSYDSFLASGRNNNNTNNNGSANGSIGGVAGFASYRVGDSVRVTVRGSDVRKY